MPALKGTRDQGGVDPMQRHSFRDAWTIPEGVVGALIMEAVIVNINMVNWTVDCYTKYDQRKYFDIQVSSPYLHPNRGEGFTAFPEVGAKCMVCVPSDGPPPFVLSFIMPRESITVNEEEAPQGVNGAPTPNTFTYAGGRSRPKPGDIYLKGRDGNFAILHRGGVLQIGSTELAQRLYIPLNNLVTDLSQNYNHFNTGGAIRWSVDSGPSQTDPPVNYKHTFRLYANEENATIRVNVGTINDLLGEKTGDAGYRSELEQAGIGSDDPIVCELSISPESFIAADGSLDTDAAKNSTFRFMIDKNGGTFLRGENSILLATGKKLRIKAKDTIEISSEKDIILRAGGMVRLEGGPVLELTAGVTKVNGGTKPVATVGSNVNIVTAVPIPIITSQGPGTINVGAIFTGLVTTGNPTILA